MFAYISVVATTSGSELHAARNGWKYPLTRGEISLLDLIDVMGSANSSKKKPWKPMPRPWSAPRIAATAIPLEEARQRTAHLGKRT